MNGFVYIWRDRLKNLYYIGSHIGSLDDGYVCSSKIMKQAFNKRPSDFKRRILESYDDVTREFILARENVWLSLIKISELDRNRYYNLKNVAAGGDIFNALSEEKKKQFRIKCSIASRKYMDSLSDQQKEQQRTHAFGGNKFCRDYLVKRNKELCSRIAEITFPCGKLQVINNVADFAKEHKLNYGNLKSVLRGDRLTVNGFRGKYLNE